MIWGDDVDKENLKSDMKVIDVSIELKSDDTRVYEKRRTKRKKNKKIGNYYKML